MPTDSSSEPTNPSDPTEPSREPTEPVNPPGKDKRGEDKRGEDVPASSESDGPAAATGVLDRYFKISERGSTLNREFRGGLVSFCLLYTSPSPRD